MKKIIATFNYDNAEYIIYEENKEYVACKRVNGEIDLNLTNDEKKMVNTIFDNLKVKSCLRLSNINFEGKDYQHYYDPQNNFHAFLNIDGSKLLSSEFIKLNKAFNHMDEVVYTGENNKTKSNFIGRLVNYGTRTIFALMIASSLVPSNATLKAYASDSKTFETLYETTLFTESELSDEEKIKNIKETIQNNKNLTEEEKKFILSGYKIVEENVDFLDYNAVNNRFANLNVLYVNKADETGKVGGTFSPSQMLITIYHAENFKGAARSVFGHETSHVFQGKYYHPGLYEPLNEIFNFEYYGSMNGYRESGYDLTYVKILMEIIGSEPCRQYNFSGDLNSIINALKEIINDEKMINDLFYSMDNYTYLHYEGNKEIEKNHMEDYLDAFYTKKFGKSMYTNPKILSMTYPYVFTAEDFDIKELKNADKGKYDSVYSVGIVQTSGKKYYFNKDLVKNAEKEVFKNRISANYLTSITLSSSDMLKLFSDAGYYFGSIDELVKKGYVKVVDKSKDLYSYEDYDVKYFDNKITEEFLVKHIDKINKEVKKIHKSREDNYNQELMLESDKELECVKDTFKVKKIDSKEKMIYYKNGSPVINIDSKDVKKMNKTIANKAKTDLIRVEYYIIPELNIISVYIRNEDCSYVSSFNVSLSTGKKYNVSKGLQKYGAPDSFLNGYKYFFTRFEDTTYVQIMNKVYNEKTKTTGYSIEYKGALRKKVNMIDNGKISFNSKYAKEVNSDIDKSFKNGYNYLSYNNNGFVSFIVYDNKKVKVYNIDSETGEKYDISKLGSFIEGEDISCVFQDENTGLYEAKIVDGNLQFFDVVGIKTRGK